MRNSSLRLGRVLVLAAALLWSVVASGGQAVVTWTPPTKLSDGTPTPASGPGSTTGYRLEYILAPAATCSPWPSGTATSKPEPASATTDTITGLSFGTWCFRAYTENVSGESVATNVAPKTFAVPLPGPPGDGTITVAATTVYDIVKQKDRLVMLPVGTVPADTKCDVTQSVNGYYAVPSDAATWFGSVRPPIVFAQCT